MSEKREKEGKRESKREGERGRHAECSVLPQAQRVFRHLALIIYQHFLTDTISWGEKETKRERRDERGKGESGGNRMMTHKFPILWACRMLLPLMAV